MKSKAIMALILLGWHSPRGGQKISKQINHELLDDKMQRRQKRQEDGSGKAVGMRVHKDQEANKGGLSTESQLTQWPGTQWRQRKEEQVQDKSWRQKQPCLLIPMAREIKESE